MVLGPVELLQRLIQTPSVNQMGRDIAGPCIGEERLTNFLQSHVEKIGLPWLRQRVHPGRDNLVALLRGNPSIEQGGEFLLLDVHQDTVPVDGMTVDPFGGELREGRIYGRGASDVKGSMASMMVAIAATGVPTVVFGPGSIAQAHTADEFIEINQLLKATDIFAQIASEGLKQRSNG